MGPIRFLNARSFADDQFHHVTVSHQTITHIEQTSQPLPGSPQYLNLETLPTNLPSNPVSLVNIDLQGRYTAVPGALDIHIHSREPGLTHKEDWRSLTDSCMRGGVTYVCDMPNTIPPTMDRASILEKAEYARASGIGFSFYLGVGAGNIDQIASLLSDDHLPLCGLKVYYGQSTGDLMYSDLEKLGEALKQVSKSSANKLIVFHSEDQCMIDANQHAHQHSKTGHHDCEHSLGDPREFLLHSQIRSSEAAHSSTKTILKWAKSYGGPIHLAHVSTPYEIELVLEARKQGVQVTAEVAPHHLFFSTDDYQTLAGMVKMNPPVRSPEERDRLMALFGNNQIEVFATDHAPHTIAEKRRALAQCPSGVPALEVFYPLLLQAAKQSGLSPAQAVAMATSTPAALLGLNQGARKLGQLSAGFQADLVLIAKNNWTFETPRAKCGWSPYQNWTFDYRVALTMLGGVIRYVDEHKNPGKA